MKKSKKDPLVEYTYRDHQDYLDHKRWDKLEMILELAIAAALLALVVVLAMSL